MKGIVVEIKGNNAIVMSAEGNFIKVQNKSEYTVGMEINAVSVNSYKQLKHIISTVV